jgi:hypothetical protein
MPFVCYIPKNFREASTALIKTCNQIIRQYTAAGYQLTLRQLYYQLVSRAVIPNTPKSYDNLGALVNDARLAGLIDWNAIEDRTRNLSALPTWNDPEEIVSNVAGAFHVNWWEGQDTRVEVWIEKDALVGVIEEACQSLDTPFFSCRGYTSQSEMWGAAQRIIRRWNKESQETVILHLGDHDPSGLDMTRDITDRLAMFCEHHGMTAPRVNRIALTREQIDLYNPPPNPAKISDSRAAAYIAEHGDESWELDALEPDVINNLIREHIERYMDEATMRKRRDYEDKCKEQLDSVSDHWDEVADFVEGL